MSIILDVLLFFILTPIMGVSFFILGMQIVKSITTKSFYPLFVLIFWNLPEYKKSLIEILDEAEAEDEFFGVTAWEMNHNQEF